MYTTNPIFLNSMDCQVCIAHYGSTSILPITYILHIMKILLILDLRRYCSFHPRTYYHCLQVETGQLRQICFGGHKLQKNETLPFNIFSHDRHMDPPKKSCLKTFFPNWSTLKCDNDLQSLCHKLVASNSSLPLDSLNSTLAKGNRQYHS